MRAKECGWVILSSKGVGDGRTRYCKQPPKPPKVKTWKSQQEITRRRHKALHCPNCGGTELIPVKKGFSVGKAVVGGLLVGPLGLVAGAIGSNKIKLVCLSCRHTF